jgi:DNA repair protein RadA/Sms
MDYAAKAHEKASAGRSRKAPKPSTNGDGKQHRRGADESVGPGESPPSSGDGVLDRLEEADAADLAAEGDDLPLEYLPFLGREGYFVKGWSHLLASYPRCGKTELIVQQCSAWLKAGERILYLSEEPRPIWRRRLSSLQGPWNGMRIVFALGTPPTTLLRRVRDGEETVVIVDSIRNLGLLGDDECNNTAMAAALGPWISAARQKDKTLGLLHHMRKGAGQHGEGISGGHALLGCVDVAIELRRDNIPNRRTICGYARLIQVEDLLYELVDGRLVALGTPSGVTLAEARRRVFDALDGEWLKTSEVRERLDAPKPSLEIVRRALLSELEAGHIERDPPLNGTKVAGKSVRWRQRPP